MGILGELNQLAKAGRLEQVDAYLSEELNSTHENCSSVLTADMCSENPRTMGADRRRMHHNMEISFASVR